MVKEETAMQLQVYKNRDKEYVRIVESFRDPETKKPKLRVIESFGNKEKLLSEDPNALEALQTKVDRMNADQQTVTSAAMQRHLQSFIDGESLTSEHSGAPLLNYGFEVYQKLWDALNLDYFFQYRQKQHSNIQFPTKVSTALMTYARLLYPDSKRATFEGKARFTQSFDCEQSHMYRTLSFLAAQKEHLESHLNKQIGQMMDRQLAVAFYDVTTYYFESVAVDDLKKFGFSKDNKVNQVQVVMGLLIDANGIPVSYELFPGNTNDFKTLEPALKKLKRQYGISKMIIVADRGLNSRKNLLFLKSIGFEYIMGYKIRSGSKRAKAMVLDDTGYTASSPAFKWKHADFDATVRVDGQSHTINDQLLVTWSLKRQMKDRRDRERIVTKSKRLVDSKAQMKSEMKKGGKKYVQLTFPDEEAITFNDQQLEIDEQFDGYYGIQYSDPDLSTEEILDAYHGLWKIEESFRVMKSNLEARPIYVWTEESIQGHFVLCYLSLVIQRLLEYFLKAEGLEVSTEKIQDALRSAKLTQIEVDGRSLYIKNQATEVFADILKALDLEDIPVYGQKDNRAKAYIQRKK